MRKKKLEITDKKEIEAVIQEAQMCRLGLCKGGVPYVVPMNFGYKDDSFYFHTGIQGLKIDYLEENKKVCVQLDVGCEVERGPTPCKFNMKYKSVIAFGDAVLIQGIDEKKEALRIITGHYAHETTDIPEDRLENLAVIKITVSSITGKKRQ